MNYWLIPLLVVPFFIVLSYIILWSFTISAFKERRYKSFARLLAISLGVPLVVFAGFNVLTKKEELVSKQGVCSANVKNLALEMLIYMDDNNESLPLADRWCDSTLLLANSMYFSKVFRCPLDDAAKKPPNVHCSSYAFNAALSGVNYKSLENPETIIMIFESDRGWNAAGGAELLPKEPRHFGKDIYGFADGHIKVIPRDDMPGPEHWKFK